MGDPGYSAAAAETDAFGNPRIGGNRIDIGAHEYVLLSALQHWRQTHFGTVANTGDAADSADPDCDGLGNLLEFALADQDPNAATPGAIISTTKAVLEFARNPAAAAEITYIVRFSSDLESWSPLAVRPAGANWTGIDGVIISESTGYTNFSDLRDQLGPAGFYQLQITSP